MTDPQIPQNYRLPHADILRLADYELAPAVSMDTKKEYMLLKYRSTYKTLADLNEEEIGLAGARINSAANIAASVRYFNNLKIRKINHTDKEPLQVAGLPDNPRIANVVWSPDETMVAFTHTALEGVELWVLRIASAKATRLTPPVLNGNLGNPVCWFRDNNYLLARMLPANRQPLTDAKKNIPTSPIISTSDGEKAQNRTYQDLLKNPTDEANFVTVATSELHKIDLTGKTELFKPADMYCETTFSPDGNYLLIGTLHKPFSYLVPFYRFPQTTVVYSSQGEKIRTVNETPLSEALPKGFMAVPTGKREMRWRSDAPATLFFVESLDNGDPQTEAEHRDALYLWNASFADAPVLMTKTKLRFCNIYWGDETTAAVDDYWYDTREMRTYLINPSEKDQTPRLLFERNFQDIYADPGSFEMRKNKYGKYVLAIENGNIYLIGEGYTVDGKFPFIDELNLADGNTTRLYQSKCVNEIEEIFSIEDFQVGNVLVRIESKTEYPNYYFRNIKRENALTQLTFFPNPFKSIENVRKEVIKYRRKDGVELSGTLYLPFGYDEAQKEKLPLLIWAYPAEYKDKQSAGQTTSNPNEFTFPYYGSFVYWVARGYAVMDNAAFPIVGEGGDEPNDTFVEQLVANAEAAIDAVDALGIIDRSRVAVGGHSYGAFMTANLLTYSDLFACGIARSGAYNRTLTPFGFQSEQRTYWEAPDVYNKMSPFINADKMKTPLLLVHGEADNNSGTFTLQTERYFQALKGLGAPARLLILPKEKHSYEARENILHLLWEQDEFLEKHLRQLSV